MKVDFSGEYLNADTAHDGDIAEITGEGEFVTIEYQGKPKQVFNLPVLVNGKKLIYSPNQKAGKALVKEFGSDSKDWIGKKFSIKVVLVESFGKESASIRITPISAKKV